MTVTQDVNKGVVPTVGVKPVAGHIGADITDVDIARPLSAEYVDAIRDALHPEIFTVDPTRYEKRYGQDYRAENRKRQHSYFTGWHTVVVAD
jgi:alpha-ketoglutarate-dependent sulfate ester dioxygenase